MVALIDTAVLLRPLTARVWKMCEAMSHFGLKGDHRVYESEYICKLTIPATAVIACCQPEYVVDTALLFMKALELRDVGKTSGVDSLC